MSPTTSGRSTAPDTARVRKSISSIVTGTVPSWPSTTTPAVSPTSKMSMPACSAKRAPGASYAVTMTIVSPRLFRSARCVSVSLPGFTSALLGLYARARLNPGTGFQNDVVDEACRADARGGRQHRHVSEVEHFHVFGYEPVESAACRSDRIRPIDVCRTAGFEGAWERQCLPPLLLREIGVSGRQRQAVRVSNGGQDTQVEFDVKVADHPAQDGSLLRVLLTEVRHLRAHDVEELQAHRGDPAEVPGARSAFRSGLFDVDPGCVPLRVHLLDGRREQKVDACRFRQLCVMRLVARVARQVFVRAELDRVDEQGHHHGLALVARSAEQGEMPVVECTHRRHEPDAPATGKLLAHLSDLPQGLHLAVASA